MFCLFNDQPLSGYTKRDRYCDKLNVEAEIRIQLSSIKPDIKEIYKSVKQCQSSH